MIWFYDKRFFCVIIEKEIDMARNILGDHYPEEKETKEKKQFWL